MPEVIPMVTIIITLDQVKNRLWSSSEKNDAEPEVILYILLCLAPIAGWEEKKKVIENPLGMPSHLGFTRIQGSRDRPLDL